MAKTKAKRSTKVAKASVKRAPASAKKPSKSVSAKKASGRAPAKAASSSRKASAPVSTDIRQAYKSFLLGDYLGEKKSPPSKGRKTR